MSAISCMPRAMTVALVSGAVTLNSTAVAQPLVGLIAELDEWLDQNSTLPPAEHSARVRFSEVHSLGEDQGAAISIGARTRGLYDPESRTITLIEPWTQSDPIDLSVLLHELVHHRQPGVHGYCPSAQEPQAYGLQEKWLAARGLKLDVDWIAIQLTSGCGLHDVHP